MRPFFSVLALACILPSARAETSVIEIQKITPVPQVKSLQTTFSTRPETNDVQFLYAPAKSWAFGLHGIRNHWPKELELHFGFARLNAKLADSRSASRAYQLFALTGAGLGNKLNGINRFAILAGFESVLETPDLYLNASAWTIGARDYDQKYFVQARCGFPLYRSDPEKLQSLFLLHALYENHAAHDVEWGPVMRFTHKNVMAEFFGSFKGAFGFAFGWYY